MKPKNTVFIATSLDGYIADKDGGTDWLHAVPNRDGDDMGYNALIARTDALVMGRNTFETVAGFDIDWPYTVPVFVLSNSLQTVPDTYREKVELVRGSLADVLEYIHSKGHKRLYIDGGSAIQSFLREDLIDEMIITTIPILLGGGFALFGEMKTPLHFELVESKTYLGELVQSRYLRKR